MVILEEIAARCTSFIHRPSLSRGIACYKDDSHVVHLKVRNECGCVHPENYYAPGERSEAISRSNNQTPFSRCYVPYEHRGLVAQSMFPLNRPLYGIKSENIPNLPLPQLYLCLFQRLVFPVASSATYVRTTTYRRMRFIDKFGFAIELSMNDCDIVYDDRDGLGNALFRVRFLVPMRGIYNLYPDIVFRALIDDTIGFGIHVIDSLCYMWQCKRLCGENLTGETLLDIFPQLAVLYPVKGTLSVISIKALCTSGNKKAFDRVFDVDYYINMIDLEYSCDYYNMNDVAVSHVTTHSLDDSDLVMIWRCWYGKYVEDCVICEQNVFTHSNDSIFPLTYSLSSRCQGVGYFHGLSQRFRHEYRNMLRYFYRIRIPYHRYVEYLLQCGYHTDMLDSALCDDDCLALLFESQFSPPVDNSQSVNVFQSCVNRETSERFFADGIRRWKTITGEDAIYVRNRAALHSPYCECNPCETYTYGDSYAELYSDDSDDASCW